jgi:hypothetical protein
MVAVTDLEGRLGMESRGPVRRVVVHGYLTAEVNLFVRGNAAVILALLLLHFRT